MLQGLDVESQGRRDGVDRLPIEPFKDGGFARVVQPSADNKKELPSTVNHHYM